MIPRHRPPFGIATLLRTALFGSGPSHLEQLERQYAEALLVPHAIWIPSARYGICHALRCGTEPLDRVVCPAFTCGVVHQAVRLSGREMILADCSDDDMLLDLRCLQQIRTPPFEPDQAASSHNGVVSRGCAVVLSEVFGHRFPQSDSQRLLRRASLRIFDMAMCIPTAGDLERLTDRDVAVVSFGLGKSLYAGWGGMAFTKDAGMAASLREQRHRDLHEHTQISEFRRNALIWLRTLAHSRWLYRLSRRAAERRAAEHASTAQLSVPSNLESLERLSRDWWHTPTPLHLKLAQRNLRRSAAMAAERIDSGRLYRSELRRLCDDDRSGRDGWFRLPAENLHALSHFCLRVNPEHRDQLRQHLWQAGIDTAILFPFPEGHCRKQLPNAAALTNEILGLTLSNGLGQHHIRGICALVADFFARREVGADKVNGFRRAA